MNNKTFSKFKCTILFVINTARRILLSNTCIAVRNWLTLGCLFDIKSLQQPLPVNRQWHYILQIVPILDQQLKHHKHSTRGTIDPSNTVCWNKLLPTYSKHAFSINFFAKLTFFFISWRLPSQQNGQHVPSSIMACFPNDDAYAASIQIGIYKELDLDIPSYHQTFYISSWRPCVALACRARMWSRPSSVYAPQTSIHIFPLHTGERQVKWPKWDHSTIWLIETCWFNCMYRATSPLLYSYSLGFLCTRMYQCVKKSSTPQLSD